MSEQACKCGRLRDIHILLTQDECAGYEPAASVAEPQETIIREVEFVIGDNEARPIKHRFQIMLERVDDKGLEWKVARVRGVVAEPPAVPSAPPEEISDRDYEDGEPCADCGVVILEHGAKDHEWRSAGDAQPSPQPAGAEPNAYNLSIPQIAFGGGIYVAAKDYAALRKSQQECVEALKAAQKELKVGIHGGGNTTCDICRAVKKIEAALANAAKLEGK